MPRPRPSRTVLVGGGKLDDTGEDCDVLGEEGNGDAWDGEWCAQVKYRLGRGKTRDLYGSVLFVGAQY